MSLIVTPGHRDQGVHEMIKYFDQVAARFPKWEQMSTEERFACLKKAEREAVMEQAELCMADFAYTARNYFWITNKHGEDQLFTLWESQWLVLQKFYELKARGVPQKILILKARQLGISLLVEALIGWRTMFFPNTKALIVSVVRENSSDLFAMMLHIYDHMPWWLKPQLASREEKDGLWFENPDPEQRRLRPGLNSRIYVQHSTQVSGVGQGKTLRAVHLNEYADFMQRNFESIIEGDLLHAIADNPEAFAILESTGRGAGTYSHMLWQSCEKLGERAEWYPLFLPWFFESTRVLAPPKGWHVMKAELGLRERIASEWVRCPKCSQYLPATFGGETRVDALCPACKQGNLETYILTDPQAYWKESKRLNAEAKSKESLKKHISEMATTAQQSFQLSGYCVFDDICIEKVNNSIRDPLTCPDVRVGFFDSFGRIHGCNRHDKAHCFVNGCDDDHRFDENNFTIWEMPLKDHGYCVGVDISEGIGQDFSVISVNKLGKGRGPDEQVAIWRSNTVDPLELAFYCNLIGRMYNEALMAVEYNTGFRSTADTLRFQFQYPNFFQWKLLDSPNPLNRARLHWFTMVNTKPKLWQTMRKWVKGDLFVVRSPNTLAEMQTFQRLAEGDPRDQRATHVNGQHDDELMSTMISLYCAHEAEADERGNIPLPMGEDEPELSRFRMECQSCGFGAEPDPEGRYPWGAARPDQDLRCPKCFSIRLRAVSLEAPDARTLRYDETMDLLNKGARSVEDGPQRPTGTPFWGLPGKGKEHGTDMY